LKSQTRRGGWRTVRSPAQAAQDGVGRGDRLDDGGDGTDGGGLDDGGHGGHDVVDRGRHDVNFRETVFLHLWIFDRKNTPNHMGHNDTTPYRGFGGSPNNDTVPDQGFGGVPNNGTGPVRILRPVSYF